MSWEYRVVERTWPDSGETRFGIYEVYYEDGATEPDTITTEPVEAEGETVAELRADLGRQIEALEKPVLDHDKIGRKLGA